MNSKVIRQLLEMDADDWYEQWREDISDFLENPGCEFANEEGICKVSPEKLCWHKIVCPKGKTRKAIYPIKGRLSP